jgi:UDPglucose 6-dehydrogenase
MSVNESQKVSIVEKIKLFYQNELSDKVFGIWGLSFKPETDDVREAPSLFIAKELAKLGAKMKAYDPEAIDSFKVSIDDDTSKAIEFVYSRDAALENVDALVICTEWNEFRRPDINRFPSIMKSPNVFDGRNLYDLEDAQNAGLNYISVGRPSVYV